MRPLFVTLTCLYVIFVPCALLSAPPLTATPSFFASNKTMASRAASLAMLLAAKRQETSSKAIGFFFYKAVSLGTTITWGHKALYLVSTAQVH